MLGNVAMFPVMKQRLLAFYGGVQLLEKRGTQKLVVEGDSSIVIKVVKE